MKPIQVYLTNKEHQDLKVLAAQEGITLTALIRASLGLEKPEPTPPPANTPFKESPAPSPYSPPVIRNLATDEPVDDNWNKRYDPKHPFKSPFGPLPIQQVSPMAVCDPNYDDEINLPLDVDERNAWLERE